MLISSNRTYSGIAYSMRLLMLALVLSSGVTLAQGADVDQLFKAGIEAQQRGDFPAAIRYYHRFLALRPGSAEVEVNLGAALAHEGRFDEAIAEYRLALPQMEDKNGVLINIALAYYKKGDWEKASIQFETVHKSQPDDARVALLLGDCYLHLGKPTEAVALMTPLQTANSQNADFDYVLGSALVRTDKKRDGVSFLEKSAELNNSPDAYMLAGSTLLQLSEFDRARHDLDIALKLNPTLPGIYTLAGKARDQTGDMEAAAPVFREALKLNPNDFDANLYLGSILYKQRHLPEAKIYLDKALELNPSSNLARYQVAMLESTMGQDDAAAKRLEELVHDDPNWLAPHVELAALYYKLHRPADGARERETVERLTAAQQSQGPQP